MEFFTEFNIDDLRRSALINIRVCIPENFFIKNSHYNRRAKESLKKMIDDNPINRPSMYYITSECSFIKSFWNSLMNVSQVKYNSQLLGMTRRTGILDGLDCNING
jgi:hypothetical protein